MKDFIFRTLIITVSIIAGIGILNYIFPFDNFEMNENAVCKESKGWFTTSADIKCNSFE